MVVQSAKGQITLPQPIIKKYKIGKDTHVSFMDKGKGIIVLKVLPMPDCDDMEYYETEKSLGLRFKKPVDPKILMNAVSRINGRDK